MTRRVRVALVYTKSAKAPPRGMDIIRWLAIGHALEAQGVEVELVTNHPGGVAAMEGLRVRPAAEAPWDDYDLVKVCYQGSLVAVPEHRAICVRMCRVVDEEFPKRDDGKRAEYLAQQEEIAARARFVAFNDAINARRWMERYGTRQRVVLTPTGCPREVPSPGPSPYPPGPPVLLHCGSVTSLRLLEALPRLADALERARMPVRLAHLGRNRLHLYGGRGLRLDPRVWDLGETDVDATWNYLHHAGAGLALAPSEHVFESELSKIYSYLRAGLPVVTEDSVPNRTLIETTGHGAIAPYDAVEGWLAAIEQALRLPAGHAPTAAYMVAHHTWDQRARTYRELLAPTARPWGVVRIDDVEALDASLLAVWDLLEARGIPLHLEVVPERITAGEAARIAARADASRVPILIHQHGYRHVDHGDGRRRFEFGKGRDPAVQAAEIGAGADRLAALFPGRARRTFSAPWNRLDGGTVRALETHGFTAYSAPRSSRGLPAAERVQWIPMTVDPVDWGGAVRPWTRAEIVSAIRESAGWYAQVGVMLHPAVMDGAARVALAEAIDEIGEGVCWTTMEEVAGRDPG